ncbi:unnamed protein product [Ambrosiozyma monospora]|uniref:DNA mismatch repair protein MSH3 n=1 Tax=Ambrosiozyma monospora TaxID=43982 RepID=A0A9W6T7H1_AMBMO|nr:unnamed protein product [Ambrosiozyma monospora]
MQLQQKLLNVAADDAFKQFLLKIDDFYSPIHKIIRNFAIFDCLLSLAVASLMNDNYSKPIFVDQQQIHLINSSNPVVQLLKPTGYVSNTIDMSMEEGRIAIITGPNMGGKSSFMRQVALIVIMAQMGCYIPASRGSKLGIFDSIFVRMGAHDDIIKSQSTFQVEMNEYYLLTGGDSNVGNGGKCLPFVLFVTHYQNLQNFAKRTVLPSKFGGLTGEDLFKPRHVVKNYHLGFRFVNGNKEELMFTYKLMPGGCDRSYGIHCARLAGLPIDITNVANQISKKFEVECNVKRGWNLINEFNNYYCKDTTKDGCSKIFNIIDNLN